MLLSFQGTNGETEAHRTQVTHLDPSGAEWAAERGHAPMATAGHGQVEG